MVPNYCIKPPKLRWFYHLTVSISSGQRNLMKTYHNLAGQRNFMKTYHNLANTGGITKIAFKNMIGLFGQSRWTPKIAKF